MGVRARRHVAAASGDAGLGAAVDVFGELRSSAVATAVAHCLSTELARCEAQARTAAEARAAAEREAEAMRRSLKERHKEQQRGRERTLSLARHLTSLEVQLAQVRAAPRTAPCAPPRASPPPPCPSLAPAPCAAACAVRALVTCPPAEQQGVWLFRR